MGDLLNTVPFSSTYNKSPSLNHTNQFAFQSFHDNFNDSFVSDYDQMADNNTFLEDEIRREFQNTLRKYLYELYKKRKREELYDVPWTLIILLSFLYGSLSLISLFGNGLVIWVVVVSRKMRTITNMYIVNLAISDVIIGLFAIPFQFQAALLQRWHLPNFMCAFCPFFQVLSVNLSVFTLCAIALDRHRAVMHPLKAHASKKQAISVIASIWVLAVLLALPTLFDYKVVTARKVFMPPHPYCRNVGLPRNIQLIYNQGLVGTQYFIPLVLISVVYVRMGIRLWGRTAPGNKEESRDARLLKSKKRIIKMLALVVILFGVCWLPLQLYNFVQYIYPKINNYQYINVVWFCIHWMAMSNSCVNPFIYAIYNDKFQDEFATRLVCLGKCCRFLRRKRREQSQHSSSTGGDNPAGAEDGNMDAHRTSSMDRAEHISLKRFKATCSFEKVKSESSSSSVIERVNETSFEITGNGSTDESLSDRIPINDNSSIEEPEEMEGKSCNRRKKQCRKYESTKRSETRYDIVTESNEETGATRTITVLITNHSNML